MKTVVLSFIATSGIIFQNMLTLHGWIFYLLFTTYILLVKEKQDILKLSYTFLLGILLSMGVWELTGLLMKTFLDIKYAMSLAAFAGIFTVLSLRNIKIFNMTSAFFIGMIAYYGLALPPSLDTVGQIVIPASLGVVCAFLLLRAERSLFIKSK